MLLDELVDLASSLDSSVVVLLRKCLILGHKLGNQQLVKWANQELEGYSDDSSLPSYRKIGAGAKAIMSGHFGAQISNFPVPSFLLEEQHRHFATDVALLEPIASYEELMKSDSTLFQMNWPADLCMYYQNKVVTQNRCHLVHAWQEVPRSAFAQLFDAVKNRTLGLALELQGSLGEEPLERVKLGKAEEIERSVVNNIYGGVNVIASGRSRVQNNNTDVNNTNSSIDREHLSRLLEDGGLSESDIDSLHKAVDADKPQKIGLETREWLRTTGSKLLVGGVKVTSTVAQAVVTEYLKQHFGVK